MFDARHDEEVIVGIPSIGKSDGSVISGLGGTPVWHDPTTAPIGIPQCLTCLSPMVFVAQLYAPVDAETHRSLYFFACPSNCSLTSQGWMVVRNQSQQQYDTLDPVSDVLSTRDKDGLGATNETTVADSSAGTEENGLVDWGQMFATASLGVGGAMSADGDGCSLEDIEAMLVSRGDHKKSGSKYGSSNSNNNDRDTSASGRHSVPLSHVASTNSEESMLVRGISRNRVEVTGVEESSLQTNDVSHRLEDEKSMRLLQAYIQEQRDDSAADNESRRDLEIVMQAMQSKGTSLAGKAHNHDDDSTDDDGDEEDEEERAMNKLSKTEQRFMNTTRIAPHQVFRYAYGGNPLWCADISHQMKTLASLPPACSCGAKRMFECQLMPAAMRHVSRDVMAQFPRGSDFDIGVVVVWSCDASCDQSHQEFVVVQPPVDSEICARLNM